MRNKFKLLLFSFVVLITFSCGNSKTDNLTGNGKDGRKIVETGELAAVDTRSFVLARYGNHWYQMKIIGILKHGTIVKAGDSIIRLDPSEIKKFIIDRETDLESHQVAVKKMIVDQENKRQELESKLKTESATFDLKKLELESSRFESERIKKIKKLEFEQAKIQFAKAKRLAELSKKINMYDVKMEQIKTNNLKKEIKSFYALLPSLTIRTPISGIFQVGTNRRNGEMIKIGDDIYANQNMGNVPDLTWMQVNTTVSENDFMRINPGQKVIVRLDALPKVSFKGEVTSIGKLCHLKDYKSRQKVFDVVVKILKSDERLKPGMTVSCEYN